MSTPSRKSRVDDDEIGAVFGSAETPVLMTSDVAEQLPISRRATLNRLKSFRDEGHLESMDVSPKAQVWWATDDSSSQTDAPAAPLRDLVGMPDEDGAAAARARSREWREAFDQEVSDPVLDGES